MPSLTLNFRPESIGAGTPVNIYLPDEIVDDMPVLYLLHGMYGDQNSWINGSAIGRYARARGMAVIMPAVGNSFYANQKHGCRYFDYVAHELPEYIGKLLPFITKKREKTFVSGLSMGGYGAIKVALRNPDRFSAAAGLSGCLNLKFNDKGEDSEWDNICVCNWGEDYVTSFPGSEEDLLHLVDTFPADKEKPRLYIACGTEDFLYKQNLTFKDYLEGKGFDYLYEEGPGAHTWDFWDKWIVPAIEFFFEEKNK